MSQVLASIYSLAKSNNGLFKSEKQAAFIIAELDSRSGLFVEMFSFGEYNGASATREVYVTWDQSGIVSITTKAPKSGKTTIKFQRATQAEFEAANTAKAQALKVEMDQLLVAFIKNLTDVESQIEAIKAESDQLISLVKANTNDQAMIAAFIANSDHMVQVKTKGLIEQANYWKTVIAEHRAKY